MSPYLGVSLVFWLSVTTFKSRDLSRDPTKVALMRDLLKKKKHTGERCFKFGSTISFSTASAEHVFSRDDTRRQGSARTA